MDIKKRKGAGEMIDKSGRGAGFSPALHMTEQDRADLERFRTALVRLDPRQKKQVIDLMLGKPDTP